MMIGQFENVYCKISGMVTEADWKNWKPEDFIPYLDVVVQYIWHQPNYVWLRLAGLPGCCFL